VRSKRRPNLTLCNYRRWLTHSHFYRAAAAHLVYAVITGAEPVQCFWGRFALLSALLVLPEMPFARSGVGFNG
jgi:hypothetical protein